MRRFIEGADRDQSTLLPDCLDDWVDESNPVRVVDAFVEAFDFGGMGFEDIEPSATGRPRISPCDVAQALHIQLSQSHSVEPPPGTGSTPQSGSDLAAPAARARRQDDRRFP